ncbi:MAG: FAD-dependent oxidoreductase [Alphaproteobacteria bacterium]|nr:FAD-dependent oxidoreductase [Alphaproteobacteria bacterium]
MNRYISHLLRLRHGLDLADAGLGSLLDLAIRWWLAGIFWVSGVLKVTNWQAALELARSEYPVPWMDPVTAAWLGAGIELICPIFLLLGLATRLAALPMLVLSLVIQFYYKELPDHLFWAILLGWLAVRGAGIFSLDHLIAPAIRRTALPLIEPVADAVAGLTRYGSPLYQLFLRLWMAEIFWSSGLTKIASWSTTIALFQDEYMVPVLPPELAAYLSTTAELACPVLLAFGLGTRLAAVPLMVMTLVIQFTYLDRAEHFYWLMVLGQIALRGPGFLSLDRAIWSALRRHLPALDGRLPASAARWPRVVIVGAGFGGLAAARALRHSPVQVTVIDRRNHHLFQPLLYQVATAALSPADIAAPIREMLRDQPNTRVLLGRVTGALPDRKLVRVEAEGEAPREIPYDYLVLATGARHSYFGKDEWEKDAPGLKKIDDATAIRRRILLAFERAEAASSEDERRRLLTFVVVGAGPTGVELAGAIAELARFGMSKEFRAFDPASARVVLVQSGERVLPVFPESLSDKAKASLERLGVEVRLNGKVTRVDDQGVNINNERIDAATVLWAAGVIASPAAKWIGAEADRAGRVKVASDLSVAGRPDVFAIGDTALALDASGNPLPGLAPAAKQAGDYVGQVIHARLTGSKAPNAFRYRHRGSLATIGRKAAIADFGLLRLSGMLAWWLWGVVHVAFLVGARNRMAVALDWLWAYVTFRRGIRLITGNSQG